MKINVTPAVHFIIGDERPISDLYRHCPTVLILALSETVLD